MKARASLLVLVVLGAAVRLAYLSQPMRLDESVNFLLLGSHSLSTITTVYLSNNNHPLHTLLEHYSVLAFGWVPWCIRAPAFLAGVLAIPATYVACDDIFDRPTALLAAALVVPSCPLVEYSTNARGYMLETLLVLVLFIAAARVVRAGQRRWWCVLVSSAVLGFYTLPTMAFFFASALLWMLLSAVSKDATIPFRPMAIRVVAVGAGVSAITVLLYLPFVLVSGLADVTSNRWVKSLTWREFRAGLLDNIVADFAGWHRGLPTIAVALLLAAFLLSFFTFRGLSRFKVNPVPVTLATCLAMMTVQRVLPFARVWLPLVPLYLGSAAAGLRYLGGRVGVALKRLPVERLGSILSILELSAPALVASIGSTLVVTSGAPYQGSDQVTFRDAEPIAIILGKILRDDDAVYVHPDACYVLEYYFARHGIPFRYLYRPGRKARSIGRAFAIDASDDYSLFSYRVALDHSNLDKTKGYRLAPVAELSRAKILQIADPELAGTRKN